MHRLSNGKAMLDAKHENGVELGFGTVIECLCV